MKKAPLAILFLTVSFGLLAQAQRMVIAILPGWQFNTPTKTVQRGFGMPMDSTRLRGNFQGSIDFGWTFSDHLGLHAAYLYNDGDMQQILTGRVPRYYRLVSGLKRPLTILEIGPEFPIRLGPDDLVYVQLNVGRTLGQDEIKRYWANRPLYPPVTGLRNVWTFGAAIGYRHFFVHGVGAAVQLAYHHVQSQTFWWGQYATPEHLWDIRAGLAFRF
ncbi:MAG: hypothetical protein WBS54_03925 [Acidobacteriota bacterium]